MDVSVEEISAGVYKAVADDHQGDKIRHAGFDPEELLERYKQDAREITQRR